LTCKYFPCFFIPPADGQLGIDHGIANRSMADPILHLRFKDDLLAVVKSEGETSQYTLANQGLITQYGSIS
jgi:hypothetical protein